MMSHRSQPSDYVMSVTNSTTSESHSDSNVMNHQSPLQDHLISSANHLGIMDFNQRFTDTNVCSMQFFQMFF